MGKIFNTSSNLDPPFTKEKVVLYCIVPSTIVKILLGTAKFLWTVWAQLFPDFHMNTEGLPTMTLHESQSDMFAGKLS